jgi:dihydrodipicolinate synthase/N-acetylneuraminate lyase
MATKGEMFAGLTVALVTPFRDGAVDYDGLGKLVDWHVEQGTDCLAPVGTTGESPTLDHEEHERVIAAVVERARGRIKVMAGTGSNSTREAIRLTRFAKKAGATGALMVGPYYNKPTQEGYYRHFATVAEAVDLPIVLYNIPGRTGSNILPETIARLAKLPAIVAIKEATGVADCRAVRPDDPVRRRQPDLAAAEHRRPRRGVGGGQHRAARHEGAGAGVRGRQAGGGAALASQALPAVPRHARRRHQPHPHQDRAEAARPR